MACGYEVLLSRVQSSSWPLNVCIPLTVPCIIPGPRSRNVCLGGLGDWVGNPSIVGQDLAPRQ